MNEVFIIGKVIETSPFKFIIYNKQKDKDKKNIKKDAISKNLNAETNKNKNIAENHNIKIENVNLKAEKITNNEKDENANFKAEETEKNVNYEENKNNEEKQVTKPKKIFEKHQSVIEMKIELAKGGVLKAIAYDEKADYVLRNNFQGKIVFINGKARPEFSKNRKDINVIIKSIQAL